MSAVVFKSQYEVVVLLAIIREDGLPIVPVLRIHVERDSVTGVVNQSFATLTTFLEFNDVACSGWGGDDFGPGSYQSLFESHAPTWITE